MAKEAPLPQAPALMGEKDKEFEGILRFRLKLRSTGSPSAGGEEAGQ